MKVKPNIPDWFNRLPGDGVVGGGELSIILGYKTDSGLSKAVSSGKFPCPDFKTSYQVRLGRKTRHYWKASTVRRWLSDRNANKQA